MKFTNEQYDTLKLIALLILPIGTFLSTFLSIWEIPFADQIQQTFIALDVLSGAVVSIAKAQWEKQNGR